MVYCEDETLSSKVAQFFCEREITNVYILSGGLKMLRDRLPHLIVKRGAEEGSGAFDMQALQRAINCASPTSTLATRSSLKSRASSRFVSSSSNSALLRKSQKKM